MLDLDLTKESIIAFLDENDIRNEKGERLTFEDRRFLYDPMCDWSTEQVHKKCGQIGMSVTYVVKTLWACENLEWNTIHTFPTDSDANEFVQTKTNKIIQNNTSFFGIRSDNVSLKQVGNRNLYYKGTVSKTAMVMTSADWLVHDEYDRGDLTATDGMQSRLQGSQVRATAWLSNPSYEGVGVDEKWQLSDQKEWYVQCRNGHKHPLTWPDSVNLDTQQYICKECKIELLDQERGGGDWVAEKPGVEISGYHMTLLMAPWIPANYIIKRWNNGRDQENFHNFILGEPYSPGESKVTRRMILDNWTVKNVRTGSVYLGVDVGNVKHYVLGSEQGIFRVGSFTDWHDLDDLIQTYRPQVGVIDALPENEMSRYYVDKYNCMFMAYTKKDHDTNVLVKYGEEDKQGIIEFDRNRVIDRIVHSLLEGNILYGLAADKDFQEYMKQCSTMRRIKVTNKDGVTRYIWESMGNSRATGPEASTLPDHYFFATIYWWLAKETVGSGVVIPEAAGGGVKPFIQTENGLMSNIGQALEAQKYGNHGDF